MKITRVLVDPSGDRSTALTDAQIHDRIIATILDHRLLPGTKLGEDKLGQAFGVSRTRVRQVLIRLANDRIVTITPHRGAIVAQPDRQEAAEVFEVRRLIEPPLLAAFVARATPAELDALAALIDAEEGERSQGHRHTASRLAGEFHLQIARWSGHQTLAHILAALVTRTSLVLMRYPAREAPRGSDDSTCRCTEHRPLLTALRLKDTRAVTRLMKSHLSALERQIDFAAEPARPPDLIDLFATR